MLSDGFSYCRMKYGIHQLDIQEVDFRLRRMDVDVDVGRVDLDIEEIAREAVLRHHLHESVFNGVMQIGMFDEALVHEEILFAARLLGVFRLDDISFYADAVGFLTHGQQPFLVGATEEAHDALFEVAWIKMIHLLAVTGQREANLWVHQRDAGELLHNVTHLGLSRLEEIAPRRYIEEQILDSKRSAWLHRHKALFLDD